MQDYRSLPVWQKAHRLAVDAVRTPCVLEGTRRLGTSRSNPQSCDLNFIKYRGRCCGVELIRRDVVTHLENGPSEGRRNLTRLIQSIDA